MKRLVLVALLVAPAVMAQTTERTFELTYIAELEIPEGAGRIQMWLPYPRTDDYQDVRLVSIQSRVPTKLYQEYTYRNSMLFLSAPADSFAELEALRVEVVVRVTRREHRETEFVELEDPDGWIESSASRWLHPDALVPIDDEISVLAEVVTEGKTTVVEKARAIFDRTVDDYQGDVLVFIGLARAAGIAARFHVGFAIPPAPSKSGTSPSKETEIHGYHAWAELNVPGFGFVPVDTLRAYQAPDERDYYFGAHDADRVELTMGSDIDLNPKQSGKPLTKFVFSHAEIDGKLAGEARHQFFFKDLDLVAK